MTSHAQIDRESATTRLWPGRPRACVYRRSRSLAPARSHRNPRRATFPTPYATHGRARAWTSGTGTDLLSVAGPGAAAGATKDVASYTYNAGGYLATVTDPNGIVTSLTYDIHGRLLAATITPGSAQSLYQFSYDAVGDLAQVTLPMGATLTYAYDQGQRMTLVTNVRGETRSYTYDNNDDPLTLVTANASGATTQQHTAAYDEWGRILRSVGAASQIWNLAYDKLSNLTSTADPSLGLGVAPARRASAYDPLNRVTSQTDPLGRSVAYGYDPSDTLDSFTDARSLTTTREIDGFGETIQEVSPDRGTLSYWYDLSGNLTKRVDGDSIETDFAYDNASRRTAMTFPSHTAENTSFGYDSTAGGNRGIGRLTSVAEASGSTGLKYDAQGRVIADAKVINPGGYTTALTVQYAYDANGRVIQITYPSGDVANFSRTTDGLITTVTFTPSGGTAQTIASGVAFEPYGPIQSFVYGNGLNLSRAYDQDYRLTNITVAPASGSALINLNFAWQTDGRLAASVDQVGNRTPSAATATLLKTSLATGTNHVTGATTLAGSTSRTLTYSTGGLLTQDIRAGLTTYGYGYNAARRLTSVTQGGSTAGSYAYDFQGQRVFRETYGTGAAETAYVYDRAGHLLAEHNATTGAVNREFIWIDDMPVALADISGGTATIRYIHTGQIDEPLAVTSAAQAIIWNGYVDPMGNGSTFSTPTLSPALDMRLPGQSFQLETGSLSQNHYRDYDPSLGRYIEADPLGIDAGQNVFAYSNGDPLNLEDPWGFDVTIAAWTDSLTGHIGVGVNSSPDGTSGFYPSPQQLSGPGQIFRDTSQFGSKVSPQESFTFHTTPAQDAAIQAYIDQQRRLGQKKGLTWTILTNDCVNFVVRALAAGGLSPRSPNLSPPAEYFQLMEQYRLDLFELELAKRGLK